MTTARETVTAIPPTLVASIYGMNFEQMPELKWLLGYPWAIGLMILSAILPYLWFRRKGWLCPGARGETLRSTASGYGPPVFSARKGTVSR